MYVVDVHRPAPYDNTLDALASSAVELSGGYRSLLARHRSNHILVRVQTVLPLIEGLARREYRRKLSSI